MSNLPAVGHLFIKLSGLAFLHSFRCAAALVRKPAQNCIQHIIQGLAEIFAKEAKDEIAVLLEGCVFAAITAVGVGVCEMLGTI